MIQTEARALELNGIRLEPLAPPAITTSWLTGD
jgi:hypothetical protein